MKDNKSGKPPDKIYLQFNHDLDGLTTWCEDKIYDDDIEYIRKDSVEQLESENEQLKNKLEKLKEYIHHKEGCGINDEYDEYTGVLTQTSHRCTCGLDDLLKGE